MKRFLSVVGFLFIIFYAQRKLMSEKPEINYKMYSTMKTNRKSSLRVGKQGSLYYKKDKLIEEKTLAWRRLKFLYQNPFGRFCRFFFRKGIAARLYGAWQDSRFSKRSIEKFIREYDIDTNDFLVPEKGYESFNDFFIRKLKPGVRPIDLIPDVFVSPCDGKVLAISNITREANFFVKKKPFTLSTFLENEKLAKDFENGTLLLFRLAPYDYHRFHFPCDAQATSIRTISGAYESVNPFVYTTGVLPLHTNERDVVQLETQEFGAMMMVLVGAMLVGRIVHTYKENKKHLKGDEMGYFAFGGSSIVLLFPKDTVKIRDDILKHSYNGYETAVVVGERVGHKR